ncbi:J domain-containing protein [Parasphingorhabdus cellanae]|uniref:J domain-containing protein n=1 Tax=Parasphingorhabdus cellanae TaxID=2806553 RepID=A0ABX7T2L8_9SPHN|nr:J domain-containing protein [Parasphingorhabdus cellanae]QTD54779.1 J domain-containing protein [Parasphingorhabdus cellanae]
MTFMLVLSALVIAALVLSGRAKTMSANDWMAVAIALLSVNLLRGGNWIMGSGLLIAAAAWRGSKLLGGISFGKPEKRKPRNFKLVRARSLLGVSDNADQAAINSAWRACLSRHHPDRGGDEQTARQINRARDILLEELETINHR